MDIGCGPNHSEMEEIKLQSALIESVDEINTVPHIEGNDNHTLPRLPKEMITQIFDYLPPDNLLPVRLVCKDWYELIRAPKLKYYLELQYESVEIYISECESSEAERNLLKILKNIGPNIVELKLYSTDLPCFNDVLPNVKKLDLSDMCALYWRNDFDSNKFPNIKSLWLPPASLVFGPYRYLPNEIQITGMQLEELSIDMGRNISKCLNVVASQTSSLLSLRLRICEMPTSYNWLGQLKETLKKCNKLKELYIRDTTNKEIEYFVLENLPEGNSFNVLYDTKYKTCGCDGCGYCAVKCLGSFHYDDDDDDHYYCNDDDNHYYDDDNVYCVDGDADDDREDYNV
uniref:F-box domain-containing protein n=1 Tax=Glossina brevipalpis TaxID=37001 RepID=A0A1A9X3X4_9MUSC